MSELPTLLSALPQITGPLSLIAFLGIIFYLIYKRSVNTGKGLEFAYDYLKSISPQLKKQDFFRIILLAFLLILIFLFLFFLFLLELSDIPLYLYLTLFAITFLSFLFFANRLSSNIDNATTTSKRRKENNMGKPNRSASKVEAESNNVESLLKQKASLEKSLARLEEKKAMYGMDVPLNILNEIDYITEQLNAVRETIKSQKL